jgi:GTPase SAR1 family protein
MINYDEIEKKSLIIFNDIVRFLRNDTPKSKDFGDVGESVNIIENEIKKIEKQELTLAVIATMKAGKSTFLNAIIGSKFLPYHDRPMTVIPTEVVLMNNLSEINLVISNKLSQYIEKLISEIRRKSLTESDFLLSSSGYSNLIPFLHQLYKGEYSNLFAKGGEKSNLNVLNKLKYINHIIRISIVTGGSIEELPDVPRIEAPFVPFENIPLSDHIGSLVLIDTPGENESLLTAEEIDKLLDSNYFASRDYLTNKIDKMNEALNKILMNQLQKASICIGLVDYTGQGNKASIDIISKIAVNIGQRGSEQIFILLNKYDQKKDSEDNSGIEEFKKDFQTRFRGSGFDPENQIYPISSLYASEYRNFKSELDKVGSEKILQTDLSYNRFTQKVN